MATLLMQVDNIHIESQKIKRNMLGNHKFK